ncbi:MULTISPECIES: DUF6372 family protein [unclassified Streptomyces]
MFTWEQHRPGGCRCVWRMYTPSR